jgi:riboflavin kinase/FMN adenylyltransferase
MTPDETKAMTDQVEGSCAGRPAVVALGMFDGVHIGHQSLVRRAVEIARNRGWCAVVYTFENHPRSVFDQAPPLLMDVETRRAALYALGVDRVDMVQFTRTMANRSPRAFLKLLTGRYDVRAVVAGKDFTFGRRGAGTTDTLKALGAEMGFEVVEMPVVLLDGEKVSSTRIRMALERGEDELAARMLGRPNA